MKLNLVEAMTELRWVSGSAKSCMSVCNLPCSRECVLLLLLLLLAKQGCNDENRSSKAG